MEIYADRKNGSKTYIKHVYKLNLFRESFTKAIFLQLQPKQSWMSNSSEQSARKSGMWYMSEIVFILVICVWGDWVWDGTITFCLLFPTCPTAWNWYSGTGRQKLMLFLCSIDAVTEIIYFIIICRKKEQNGVIYQINRAIISHSKWNLQHGKL